MEVVSKSRCFDGVQGVYRHESASTGTEMRFAVYVPDGDGPMPVLYWLSGLTCTEQNFITKAGAQRYAAEHGVVIVCPDTSPRGTDLPGEHEHWDFGSGAGFYVDATEAPWSAHYRMHSYVVDELPALVQDSFPVDGTQAGICGHSMGGHGALVLGLQHPDRYRSVSALAPICAPASCPWGKKAFSAYLGEDPAAWRRWDACALIADGAKADALLVDQGTDDEFLDEQLNPGRLEAACAGASIPLTLERRAGHDHSFYFVASFIGDHIAWHAARLQA